MDGDWCTLEELEALSHLRSLQVNSLENVLDSSIATKAGIRSKKHLEYLELNWYVDDDDDDDDDEKEEEEEEEDGDDRDDNQDDEVEEQQEVEKEDDEKEEEEEHEDDEEKEEDEQTEVENIDQEKEEDDGHTEDGVGKEEQQIGPDQQQRIEDVFDELCPPPTLDTLIISNYFGRRLPNWMHSPAQTTFRCLRSIVIQNLTYCSRLPDGLCRIPGLEELLISNAPAIEHVGPDFQSVASGDGGIVSKPFPELVKLELLGLSVWKEWNWEKHSEAISMAALEHLQLTDCKLTHLPPGLACDYRYSLRSICLKDLTLLEYLENFPSVVKLDVHECPMLKTISGFSMLRTVNIDGCQKLKVLEGVPVLDNMVLDDIPWDVIGTPARCRPKGYQAGLQRQLPQDLTIIRWREALEVYMMPDNVTRKPTYDILLLIRWR
ncbi:putative disease resistance RPP13-like protein 1 isoform X2 [Miscanthus floridulus]|uniref:putative disease resistance RPP13-like protein 1 isoform X2 n=1 Tax=Miscanthus floridulus TaxID=154761 RepID=UPI00345AE3CB